MEAASLSQSKPAGLFGLGHHSLRPVAVPLALGLLLRVILFRVSFSLEGDPLVYGAIAKNLLLHGVYSWTDAPWAPTLIRLPGYPLLMALLFRIFGMENYAAAAYLQIPLDLVTCLLLAAFVARIASPRAALCALWLAALCPFTAGYTAMPLAESTSLFTIALALWSALAFHQQRLWRHAILLTLAVTYAALLRPDGALAGLALAPAALLALFRRRPGLPAVRRPLALLLLCLVMATAPFAAWTWRNWRTFHVFQPLAPRLANDPGEDPFRGWQRWIQSWCLDFPSTFQFYWSVPGDRFRIDLLPSYAIDSPAQRAQLEQLAADYHQGGYRLTPQLDQRFGQIARDRYAAHPFRSYVALPLGRLAVMWLRPRNEHFYLARDWWRFDRHPAQSCANVTLILLNAGYLLLALLGLRRRPLLWPWMLLYIALRSALLLTIQAPESRYTLECYPMLILLSALALDSWLEQRSGLRAKAKAALSV